MMSQLVASQGGVLTSSGASIVYVGLVVCGLSVLGLAILAWRGMHVAKQQKRRWPTTVATRTTAPAASQSQSSTGFIGADGASH